MALALDARPSTATTAAPSRRPWPRSALVPVVALAVAKLAFQLSVAGRYGWHRDELYYVDAGRHPALGYVDFPPVTPLLSRVATALLGDSLEESLRPFAVQHGACYTCYQYGAICSNAPSTRARDK